MIITVGQLEVFLLILGRIAGVFIQAPVLSSRSIPAWIKTAAAVWLAILLWFVTPVSWSLPAAPVSFLIALTVEVGIGFLIGFVCNVLFIAIQSAGEIMDLQMGLSVATALDPVFGAVISIVGRLCFMIALIIFITVDGHHLILSAFHQSFRMLPAGTLANFANPNLSDQLLGLLRTLWITAVKFAAPVVLLIFLSDFTFGIVSRVAPQVNVFMLGFQVKPILGIFGLLMIAPLIARYIIRLLELMGKELTQLFMFLK